MIGHIGGSAAVADHERELWPEAALWDMVRELWSLRESWTDKVPQHGGGNGGLVLLSSAQSRRKMLGDGRTERSTRTLLVLVDTQLRVRVRERY